MHIGKCGHRGLACACGTDNSSGKLSGGGEVAFSRVSGGKSHISVDAGHIEEAPVYAYEVAGFLELRLFGGTGLEELVAF